MERNVNFSERPTPMDWGKQKIVPLNIVEETTTDENGKEKKNYRADLVQKVNEPLTADNIVDAAIASEYSEEALKRIMRNIASEGDPEVESYKQFVNEVKASAIAAGYE
ncbi:hypothetical protein [uncultured Duncaniella sp.]|uniref:hypothetical protein n=1 Tax=uncultured Duncaniella sp. TaxID=2768039 RepID=UPI0026F3F946|nr:hypothetical protein [uncultured Duncaniella sp.]